MLENTLVSVCNQTDDNFDVIVVSNKTLDDFSDNSKIKNVKFIEVDWKSPSASDSWQIGSQGLGKNRAINQARLDKGSKYILALSQIRDAKDSVSHYVMFVDADDFIHKDLARHVINSNKDFLKVARGVRLGINNTFENINSNKSWDFSTSCGTSNITKVELLKQEIDFNGVDVNSPQDQIIKTTTDFYLKMIIGSHRWSFGHFEEKGYKGGRIPFHAAVYNCSHNEQHSGAKNNEFKNKLTDAMIEKFSIKTLQ